MQSVIALPLRFLVMLALFVGMALSSCTTAQHSRSSNYYTEPTPSTDTAEITGSHQLGLSLSGYAAYLSTVDGQRVEHADDWKTPHVLAAGQHTIGITYAHLGSRTTFEQGVEIKPQHRYRAAFAVKNGYHVALDQLKLWLQDETAAQRVVVFFDGEIGDSTRVLLEPR